MAEPTLRFNNVKTVLNNKNSKGANAYQSKKYPTAYILYTTLAELPDSLSDNALIFTTDTAELFVGTGSGIQRIKLGTEADLNPRLFLKILEAKEIYERKVDAEKTKSDLKDLIEELKGSVYSKEEIDDFITKDIDFDGVIDKLNLYTINKVNDLLAEKAASVDVYTQTQTNDLIDAAKQEASDNLDTYKTEAAETYATIVNAATKTELSEKETEIKNFVVEDYLSKADASSTYATIEKVDNLESDINSKIEAANTSIETNASEISNIKSSYVKADDYVSDKEDIKTSINEVKSDLTTFKTEVYKKDDVYTKAEVDSKLTEKVDEINTSIYNLDSAKVDKSDYTEKLGIIDNNFATISTNFENTYTKDETDAQINAKVNDAKDYFYKKAEAVDKTVNDMKSDLEAVEATANSAIKENEMTAAIETALQSKADKKDLTSVSQKVSALEEKEVYTKAEVDAAIETAITNVLQQMREEFKV